MSVIDYILRPLRAAFAAFFVHEVALRRAERGVRLVLEDRTPGGALDRELSRAEIAARREAEAFALMQQQLAELLDDLPETRTTLRHLVFVEKAVAKKGLRALHRVPLDVLQRALEQLEGLVVNWSPVGLATLRSKMAVAIIDREHRNPDAEADAYRTAAVMDSRPPDSALPGLEVEVRNDDAALADAYAALGVVVPGMVAMQGEIGSPSAKAVARETSRSQGQMSTMGEISLRVVET